MQGSFFWRDKKVIIYIYMYLYLYIYIYTYIFITKNVFVTFFSLASAKTTQNVRTLFFLGDLPVEEEFPKTTKNDDIGQISKIPKPELRRFWGDYLTKHDTNMINLAILRVCGLS